MNAGRRDVLLEPGCVVGANRVVVRQCAAGVEKPAGWRSDSLVLSKWVDAVVLETESEVEAGAGVIGV